MCLKNEDLWEIRKFCMLVVKKGPIWRFFLENGLSKLKGLPKLQIMSTGQTVRSTSSYYTEQIFEKNVKPLLSRDKSETITENTIFSKRSPFKRTGYQQMPPLWHKDEIRKACRMLLGKTNGLETIQTSTTLRTY